MAPLAPWSALVKEYRDHRTGFPSRRAYLLHLAAGPDGREDVMAARRLLLKPRYQLTEAIDDAA